MASPPISLLFLWISLFLFISLFSPSHSLTCASQKLSSNRIYPNCSDLPSLGATLHYNYSAANSSLAVAFTATPSKPDGWVAWGINPTGVGMKGSQALIAYKTNGKLTVETYSLSNTTYVIAKSKLSFDVWDLSAEADSGGAYTIFATVKVPEKVESLNQVWQVGPSVTKGVPDKHDFGKPNLEAKGALQVVGSTNTTSGTGNSTSGGSGGDEKSGGISIVGERFGLGFYFGLVLVILGFMSL